MSVSHGIGAAVVDASVAVRFVLGEAPWVDWWAACARSSTVRVAPAHFRAEVGNALLRGTDLTAGEVPVRLIRMAESGVDTTDRGWYGLVHAVQLADRYALTVYDALYLQLAMDIEAPLATRDQALAAAARAEGVEVIDGSS
jgi:predicted nucleic acid-binding protein